MVEGKLETACIEELARAERFFKAYDLAVQAQPDLPHRVVYGLAAS